MYISLHVKCPLLLLGFNEMHFLNIFSKDTQKSSLKIRQVEAEMFHADRRTDMTKLTVAFRNFEKTPKILRPSNRAKE